MVGYKNEATFWKKVLLLSRLSRAIYLFQAFIGLWLFSSFLTRRFFSLLLGKFLLFLVGFQFMYYSVYIINDLIDYSKDKQDKALLHKPLVSGSVTKKDAFWLILIHLSVGLAYFAIIKDFWGLLISSAAIIYNLFYTVLFKKHWFIRYLANGTTHALRLGLPILWSLFNYGVARESLALFGVAELLYLLFSANIINIRRIMDGKRVRFVFLGLYFVFYIITFEVLKQDIKIFLFFSILLILNGIFAQLFRKPRLFRRMKAFFVKTHL